MSFIGLTALFLGGAFIGAVVTVLTTPEQGSVVRQRFSRGARNLRTEVPQLISESRKAYGALATDARQTFRQIASRLATIMTTCFDAVKKNATRF
jgi:gas vesicle protein